MRTRFLWTVVCTAQHSLSPPYRAGRSCTGIRRPAEEIDDVGRRCRETSERTHPVVMPCVRQIACALPVYATRRSRTYNSPMSVMVPDCCNRSVPPFSFNKSGFAPPERRALCARSNERPFRRCSAKSIRLPRGTRNLRLEPEGGYNHSVILSSRLKYQVQ